MSFLVPLNVTLSGVLMVPGTSVQIMFKIPKKHSIMLLVAADKSTEQAIELAVLSIMVPSRQVPQLDTMLYFRDEQLESTLVQLKTSRLRLMSTN